MCSVSWPLKLEARLEVALFGYKLPATCYFHANISINMTIIYIFNAFLFIFSWQGSKLKLKIVIVWPYSLNNSGFSFRRKDWTKISSFDL